MQDVRRRSDQAAWFAGPWKASMPSGNPTPAMTLGLLFVLFSRQDLVAARFRAGGAQYRRYHPRFGITLPVACDG
jgi:hypothetical protein